MATKRNVGIISAITLSALLASPVIAGVCGLGRIPFDKRGPPSVVYHVFHFDQPLIKNVCNQEWRPAASNVWGCVSYQMEDPETWHIYLDKSLSEEDAACVLLHEKAHLPPNNWKHGSGGTTFQDEDGNWRPRIGPIRRVNR